LIFTNLVTILSKKLNRYEFEIFHSNRKYLENSELAPSTSNLYFYAIKSFYNAFDIVLPQIEIAKGDMGLDKNVGKPLIRKIFIN
jgi:hypothetical protein